VRALITGSGGLVGSECVRLLSEHGWDVTGIDNDMRRQFFGPQGTTAAVVESLKNTFPKYRHLPLDVRDRQGIRELFGQERPDFVIHAAAQPSHDKAAGNGLSTECLTEFLRGENPITASVFNPDFAEQALGKQLPNVTGAQAPI
jgi:nucleoside-diphosphate-sugar epimerase